MKKFHRIVMLGAIALIAVAAFAPIGSAATASNKTVTVKVGKKSSFLVTTTPSTGYSWKWTTAPDAMTATGAKPKVLPKTSEDAAMGAPQKARITITGVATGKTSGVLSYVAPDGTTVEKTLTVKITVS